jgi:hypothetical protein
LTSDKNIIEELRSKYLGRKGEIASLFSQLVTADPKEKTGLGLYVGLGHHELDCNQGSGSNRFSDGPFYW